MNRRVGLAARISGIVVGLGGPAPQTTCYVFGARLLVPPAMVSVLLFLPRCFRRCICVAVGRAARRVGKTREKVEGATIAVRAYPPRKHLAQPVSTM